MSNNTKIVITAETAQAESSLVSLGRGVDGVSGKFMDFSGIVGTLTGALSVAAFAHFIKGSIDAADALSKLSQKTGTSVEDLAGLKFAADQNGTSLEAVAQAGKKLSASLADKPELFAQMGVTATDSTGAIVQLADIFAAMPDGVEKTALAVKLFGKSGEEMIPFLDNGSAALRGLIEQGKLYNPVTAESALAAQQFNDNLDALRARGMAGFIKAANDLLPKLNDTVTAFTELTSSGQSFLPIGSVILTIFETIVVLGANIGYVFKMAGNEIGGMAAQLVALSTGDFKAAKAIGDAMRSEAAAARREIDAFSERIINGTPKPAAQAPSTASVAQDPSKGKALLAGMGVGSGDKDEAHQKQIDAAIAREQEKYIKLHELGLEFSATEAERVTLKYAFDLQTMEKEHLAAKAIYGQNDKMEAAYLQARVDREALANAEIAKINAKAAADKDKLDQQKMRSDLSIANFSKLIRAGEYSDAMTMAEKMSAGLATKSRAAFEVNKIAALAKATVAGYSMIVKAADDGASWGGYLGAIAEGALAAAYVAAQLDAINSTQFGGGAGGISTGGGGGGVPSLSTTPGTPVTQTDSQQPVTVNIYNTGNVLSNDYVQTTIIPQIQSAVNNSDVLIIDPRSRQAQVLGA
jgi:hypothetical protein